MEGLKINRLKSESSLPIAVLVVLVLLVTGNGLAQLSSTDPVVTLIGSFKVRVRATPEILPDNILASLMKGTQLQMTGQERGWYCVTLPDTRTGWVHGDYAKVEEPHDQLEVISAAVRVRTEPTTASESHARAQRGQRLHLLEKADGWYRVQIPNEAEGWVREDLVAPRLLALDFSPEQDGQTALLGTEPETPSEIEETEEEAEPQLAASTPEVEPDDSSVESEASELVTTPDVALPASETHPSASDAVPAEHTDVVSEVGSDWLTIMGLTGLLVLVAFMFLSWRRRKRNSINRIIKKDRSETRELELKLSREMKEARKRLNGLEQKAKGRLAEFRAVTGESAALVSKTSDDLLSNLEEMKRMIQDQQNRLNLYSELVSLQNEQMEAHKKETASLKKLLEMGNRTKGKE